MRLTLVISTLASGGAERVMSIMANYWAAKGWLITLLTFDKADEKPFYDLHPQITHAPLNLLALSATPFHAIAPNIRRVTALHRAIRESKPEVVISFMDKVNVLVLLAAFGLSVPVVVAERTDPARHHIGRAWSFLRTWLYPHAGALVVQSRDVLDFFPKRVRRRSHVIPNPVIAPPPETASTPLAARKRVMAMGRLSHEKGFDLLLGAFARLAPRHPEWSLAVWGEGEQRMELEELRDKLGLRERVDFPGRTRHPHQRFREAGLFVLPSRYEGFPNALCEAMACGLPVISFDCPSGPRNIIRNNVDGLLVPAGDVGALALAIEKLMSNESERRRLGMRAPEVVDRFQLKKVMEMWNDVLSLACNKCQ